MISSGTVSEAVPGSAARSLKADVADHKVLAAVDFHRQRLCKADTVEFTADLTAFIQPLNQRNAFDRHVHNLHIMKLQRLLKKKRERGVSQPGGQFIVRFTGKHPAKTVHLQRGFVTLLLLELKATLGNRAQLIKHGLLTPRVSGHQNVQLLLHQIHPFCVVPQAVFQQDQIDWGDSIAAAKQRACTEQANGFFQRRSETYGAEGSKSSCWRSIKISSKRIGQFYLADLLLPLVVFLVRDLQ